MTYRLARPMSEPIAHWWFFGILLLATVFRQLFFTGYFGSDEVTYTEAAWNIAHGAWPSSDYIGAIRYGVNIPVASFLWLFGPSEFAANFWSLATSVGEIALVYLLAYGFWGQRAAIFAAALLAFIPIHAHIAGRLLADPPLAFFITLSFYALWRGDDAGSRPWYLIAGLAAGAVWWVKSSVAIVYLPTFLLFLIWERRVDRKWFYMAASFSAMLILNSLLFWVISGDPLHVFHVSTSGMSEYTHNPSLRTEPEYYLRFLLFDVKHTWLLGPLALIGLVHCFSNSARDIGMIRVCLWAIGLVVLFSLTIVAVDPVRLIPKQTNYMLIFLAPLALLGGAALNKLQRHLALTLFAAFILGGVLLTALEQQVIHVFTANSKASFVFAAEHADKPVYAMTNSFRFGTYQHLLSDNPNTLPDIHDLSKISGELKHTRGSVLDPTEIVAYAIIDTQTSEWAASDTLRRIEDRPSCWIPGGTLNPTEFGLGHSVVRGLHAAAMHVPGALGDRLRAKAGELLTPKPAYVFKIPGGCVSIDHA